MKEKTELYCSDEGLYEYEISKKIKNSELELN